MRLPRTSTSARSAADAFTTPSSPRRPDGHAVAHDRRARSARAPAARRGRIEPASHALDRLLDRGLRLQRAPRRRRPVVSRGVAGLAGDAVGEHRGALLQVVDDGVDLAARLAHAVVDAVVQALARNCSSRSSQRLLPRLRIAASAAFDRLPLARERRARPFERAAGPRRRARGGPAAARPSRSRAAAPTGMIGGCSPSRAAISSARLRPGRAVDQLVGRAEAVGIEPERRAHDARRRRRVGLQRVVVRRADHERAARAEVLDDRDAERAALRSDRCPRRSRRAAPAPGRCRLAIHRRDVRDVPRERAEARRNRLLVADVGEHRSEDRQRRSRVARGTCSPACAISASSPAVLSATVLPPVFGPVMSSAVVGGSIMMSTGTGADRQVVDVVGVPRHHAAHEQRVARGRSSSRPSGRWPRRRRRRSPARAAPSPGARRARWPPRSMRARSLGALAEAIGQREQDAVDLFGFLLLERDDLVVDFDRAERLEEQGGAARRAAVDDARDRAAVLGPCTRIT